MGIPSLWEKLGEGEVVEIATYASKHFEQYKLPLRIAIDEAIWRFKFFLKDEKVAEIRRNQPAANPSEKNILWRVLQLLRLNVQLVFVTDGPGRPKKRGKVVHGNSNSQTVLLREMLAHLGVAWHMAPGEAEAECVQLQKLGIVDAVWTEDADAVMFGGDTVLRFQYTPSKKKDNYKVRVYRSAANLALFPCLDRAGLVLFAVICGADYDMPGLPGGGPELAIMAAKNGFGKRLIDALEDNTLPAWRDRLEGFLDSVRRSHIKVPEGFPDAQVVKNYYKPLVSTEQNLQVLQSKWWNQSFNEETLWPFLGTRFNLWLKEYIDLVIPIELVRSLAQTIPGQEASNSCYQLQFAGRDGEVQCKVTYLLSFATPMDIDHRIAMSSKDGWRPSDRVQADQILTSILAHAAPSVVENMPPARAPKSKPKPHQPQPTGAASDPAGAAKKRGRPKKADTTDLPTAGPKKKANLSSDNPKDHIPGSASMSAVVAGDDNVFSQPTIASGSTKPVKAKAQTSGRTKMPTPAPHTEARPDDNPNNLKERSFVAALSLTPEPTRPPYKPTGRSASHIPKTKKMANVVIDLLSDSEDEAPVVQRSRKPPVESSAAPTVDRNSKTSPEFRPKATVESAVGHAPVPTVPSAVPSDILKRLSPNTLRQKRLARFLPQAPEVSQTFSKPNIPQKEHVPAQDVVEELDLTEMD